MRAGTSAALEAESCLLQAREYGRLMSEARARELRFRQASEAEHRLEAILRPFEVLGWRLLVDRAWPGTRNGNVDFLMVGPGGVLVIDSKAWADMSLVDGTLFRGQADATDDVEKTLAVAELAEQAVADVGLVPLLVQPWFVFDRSTLPRHTLGRLQLVGDRLATAQLARLPHRLAPEQVEHVAAAVEGAFPPYRRRSGTSVVVSQQPVEPRAVDAPEQTELFERQDVVDALVASLTSAPVEEWMTFLHPDQIELVRRSWNGPARLRGAAGTGKTVVGLHRAAYLASTRPGRVLVVSFVRTLPGVLSGLFERMAPENADRVDFLGLHEFARRILDERGVRSRLNGRLAPKLFDQAWLERGEPSVLGRLAGDKSYWKEEVDYVLKGRAITAFDDYAELNRVGRRTGLQREHREAVWDLYRRYDELLRDNGVWDFNDMLLQAYQAQTAAPGDGEYVSVVVDEVQDLTALGVRLLHAVVGDAPDGLLLIGDGQQNLYPGGFTLTEAGVSVQNRSRALGVNYRNGALILERAMAHASKQNFDDLEGRSESGTRHLSIARAGGAVIEASATYRSQLERLLLEMLRRTLAMDGVHPGDAAVLVQSNAEARAWEQVLTAAGIEVTPLTSYDGRAGSGVKVGTTHRAKGLEFKYVFLPGHGRPPARRTRESDATYAERCERRLREEFVAMTRARDGLWLGSVATPA
jgi:hypothetical protein